MKTLIIIASALAALPSATSASTGMDTESRSFTVNFGDLDLATPAGQSALEKRLGVAIRQVCYEPGPPSAQRQRSMSECAAAARRQARSDAQEVVAAAAQQHATQFAASDQPWD